MVAIYQLLALVASVSAVPASLVARAPEPSIQARAPEALPSLVARAPAPDMYSKLAMPKAVRALKASHAKRDTATILSDISDIDSKVKALTSAVNSFSGGIFGAIPVSNAESALEKSINQGTTDAQATSALSSSDSSSIISAINNLIPDIKASLAALSAKKSQFQSAGLQGTVESDLKTLKTDTDQFASALIAIASADSLDQANAQKSEIDAAFDKAIAEFA